MKDQALTEIAPPPAHVAIILDGNGRWAAQRGLPRLAGHRSGARAVRRVVEACPRLGIDYLTLFAFSTENWRRPRDEVDGLMRLFRSHLRSEADELHAQGARVRFLGEPEPLSADLREAMAALETRTRANAQLNLTIALNYGARAEIAAAARALAVDAAEGRLRPDEINECALGARLWSSDLPDPDLLIRTSGEQRLSNFLLWQCAYAELVFADETWPEFSVASLEKAVETYRRRQRRYGAVMA